MPAITMEITSIALLREWYSLSLIKAAAILVRSLSPFFVVYRDDETGLARQVETMEMVSFGFECDGKNLQ